MQFHAVALLHALRATDRLAISKLVTSLVRGSVRSPLAQCLLVRYVAQVSPPPPLRACNDKFAVRYGCSSRHCRTFHIHPLLPLPHYVSPGVSTERSQPADILHSPADILLKGGLGLPQVITESGSPGGTEQRPFYDFLENCLRHKAEMVIFEAARAICNMKDVTSR